MPRQKQIRIDEAIAFENVFSEPDKFREYLDGGSKRPLVLEMGCGHGYYTLALAEKYPEKLFIGLDKKADRLWKAGTWGSEKGLDNVVFIKSFGEYLPDFFEGHLIDEIWVTFPDPHPKPSNSGKRLTSSRFLKLYKTILKPGGVIHLKTDNKALFDYSVDEAKEFGAEILDIKEDIHNLAEKDELLEILTFYEKRFMDEGKPIYYMRFTV